MLFKKKKQDGYTQTTPQGPEIISKECIFSVIIV